MFMCCLVVGLKGTQKQISQKISGKCRDSPGIILGQSSENFVYAFSCLLFFLALRIVFGGGFRRASMVFPALEQPQTCTGATLRLHYGKSCSTMCSFSYRYLGKSCNMGVLPGSRDSNAGPTQHQSVPPDFDTSQTASPTEYIIFTESLQQGIGRETAMANQLCWNQEL